MFISYHAICTVTSDWKPADGHCAKLNKVGYFSATGIKLAERTGLRRPALKRERVTHSSNTPPVQTTSREPQMQLGASPHFANTSANQRYEDSQERMPVLKR